MDVIESLKLNIQKAIKDAGFSVELSDIIIERSKDTSHGDYATNSAMKFSRLFGSNPRDVASKIIENLDKTDIEKVDIAGPGFINFFMKKDSLQQIVSKILKSGNEFGRSERKNVKVNVEFVSANPTGDLHVGTARGAAIGDSLCRILDFAGYDVTKEYYVNDAGNQIRNLGLSLFARYKEILGLPFELPEDGYYGQDVINIAKQIYDEIGDKALSFDDPIEYFKIEGTRRELDKIKDVLKDFRVEHDVFSSEIAVRSNNAVEKELEFLEKYSYKEEGAVLLRTTDFLDDKDRVIVKSNGDYTYFLPDIVYHVNKMSRGFDQLIDILGADHHGYINRMKSALMMHGYSEDTLDIELIQMVRFIKDGVEIKASKRTGNAITLREIIDEIGVDAMRYFFAIRSPSAHLDFDMNLALEQSSNNPVYYAQYAHARLCSIMETGKDIPLDETGKLLKTNSETAILKHLADFPKIVTDAANDKAVYKITNYIHDLAELIHAFYNECRVIDRDNLELSGSRLALCKACQQVIKNALQLVAVSAPIHMWGKEEFLCQNHLLSMHMNV